MTIVRSEIVEALAALPPLERRVLLMREHQRLSYNQISAALGISFDMVAARISAARRQLFQLRKSALPARSARWRPAVYESAGRRG